MQKYHSFPWDVIADRRHNLNGVLGDLSVKLEYGWIITSHGFVWIQLLLHVLTSILVQLIYLRADSRFVSSQWETSLQSKASSYWLGANIESALFLSEKTLTSAGSGVSLLNAITAFQSLREFCLNLTFIQFSWNIAVVTTQSGVVDEILTIPFQLV